ncbi:TonB-dependent receptor plug domain-containing protein [Thermodesulfobacteriota bacterium]
MTSPLSLVLADNHQKQLELADLLKMDFEELVALEVTLSTGTPKPLKRAPSVASIITAQDIEKMGAKTLSEALETVPGLHVQPSGFNRFTPVFSIRGIQTSLNPHTLLLINGVPIRDSYNGTRPPTFRMSTSLISRIEVVRGPVSAVHGADAFAGVINVITKEGPEVEGTRAGVRAGSFDTYDGWVQHGDNFFGWDIMAGLEYMKSNGDGDRIIEQDAYGSAPPSETPRPLDTHYENYDALLSLTKNNTSMKLYGSWQKDNSMGPGSQFITDSNNQDNKTVLADLTHTDDDLIDDFELTLKMTGMYSDVDSYWQLTPPGFLNLIGNPITISRTGTIDAAGLYTGFPRHRLRLSLGLNYLDMETDAYQNFDQNFNPIPYQNTKDDPDIIYCDDHYRNVVYMAIQEEWSITEGLEFTGGIRYDSYSDFGGTMNPRLALVWEARHDLILKLIYGQAFRPPTFAELYGKNNPLALGNSELEPEDIKTIELAFDYRPARRISTVFNLYYYEITDIIEFVGGATKTAQNFRDQEGYGFEFELNWDVTDTLRLKADFARQRSKDSDTETLVPDAPGMQFHVNPHWIFLTKWALDLQFYWIGDRHRAAGDTRDVIDDYELVHLTVRRKNIFKHWDVTMAVRNVFDEDARIPSDGRVPNDYPMEGRSVWGEVGMRF